MDGSYQNYTHIINSGATEQKHPLGCTLYTVKVCNLHHNSTVQIAHFHSKLRTPKRLVLLNNKTSSSYQGIDA